MMKERKKMMIEFYLIFKQILNGCVQQLVRLFILRLHTSKVVDLQQRKIRARELQLISKITLQDIAYYASEFHSSTDLDLVYLLGL